MVLSIPVYSAVVPICAKVSVRLLCYQDSSQAHLPTLGQELSAYLSRQSNRFDRIVYIGDGSNDYCPIVRLRR